MRTPQLTPIPLAMTFAIMGVLAGEALAQPDQSGGATTGDPAPTAAPGTQAPGTQAPGTQSPTSDPATPAAPGDQPADQPIDPSGDGTAGAQQGAQQAPQTPPLPPTPKTDQAIPDPAIQPIDPLEIQAAAGVTDEKLDMPLLFNSPTGHLLPAGIILTNAGVDTGGGITSDLRIGLGDVAEFGVGTNSLIRVKQAGGVEPEGISTYPTALFKMGINQDSLFKYQPAISLGFRKSFEVDHDNRTTRVAQLYLVASKSIGPKFKLHAGGVFWDASIERDDGTEVLLHDRGVSKQLRAFGGIEIEPLPRSQILLELHWVPEFELGDDTGVDAISLRPTFSWGVRYQLADWAMLESGVRVPDIQDVNLIDAQIFGQIRFVTRRFRRFLKGIK